MVQRNAALSQVKTNTILSRSEHMWNWTDAAITNTNVIVVEASSSRSWCQQSRSQWS